jgi:hypothetical protein
MAVAMVCVWNMGVRVPQRFMFVPMAVHACGHGLMDMVMVSIVMPVSVFVLQRGVCVRVVMGFHQVQ